MAITLHIRTSILAALVCALDGDLVPVAFVIILMLTPVDGAKLEEAPRRGVLAVLAAQAGSSALGGRVILLRGFDGGIGSQRKRDRLSLLAGVGGRGVGSQGQESKRHGLAILER